MSQASSQVTASQNGAPLPAVVLTSTPGGAVNSSPSAGAEQQSKKEAKSKVMCTACSCHACSCPCHVAKTVKPRRRVVGEFPPADSTYMTSFLQLFGLSHWQDYGKVWTLTDITPEKIQSYVQTIRPNLINSNIPTQRAQKMVVDDVQPRDLLTLLKQLGRIYGVKMVSKCRMTHDPVTDKYKSHQEYRFVPLPPAGGDDAEATVTPLVDG